MVKALLEDGAHGKAATSAVVSAGGHLERSGDFLRTRGVARGVESFHEFAAQVVQDRGGSEEVFGVDQREVAERPVRAAESRKRLFDGGQGAFGMLGSREGRACRGLNGRDARCPSQAARHRFSQRDARCPSQAARRRFSQRDARCPIKAARRRFSQRDARCPIKAARRRFFQREGRACRGLYGNTVGCERDGEVDGRT